MSLKGIKHPTTQVNEEIAPKLDNTICAVLGGPIYWSSKDTKETVEQITILHNSQWREFKCTGKGYSDGKNR